MTTLLLALGLTVGSSRPPAPPSRMPASTLELLFVSIHHADCEGAGVNTLTVRMNGFVIASVPTSFGCGCNDAFTTVNIDDPDALAHFDLNGCNWFEIASSPHAVNIAFVSVGAELNDGSLRNCIFDGSPSNPNPMCYGRDLCSSPGYATTTLVAGIDPDGDGIAGGLGASCDNCITVPNADQADGDFDRFGDACDGCVGTGLTDWDSDTVCDGDDNCPYVANSGQENSDENPLGDACDCAMTPSLCDDNNLCTYDYCDPYYGCWWAPVNGLDDANPCTLDSCDPQVGAVFMPLTGTPCSDFNSCTANDTCSAGVCIAGTQVAAADVEHVRWADATQLQWNAAAGAIGSTIYQLARGSLAQLPVGSGVSETCVAPIVQGQQATDADSPTINSGFWYLVRSANDCAIGSYGSASDGSPRNTIACP